MGLHQDDSGQRRHRSPALGSSYTEEQQAREGWAGVGGTMFRCLSLCFSTSPSGLYSKLTTVSQTQLGQLSSAQGTDPDFSCKLRILA